MPLPEKLLKVALPRVMSPDVKSETLSLKVTVTGIGEVLVGLPAVELIATVGPALSMVKV